MEDKAKDEILEAISTFSTSVDEQFSDIKSEMVTKDELDSRLGKSNHDLKVYIDRKMAEYHSDVFKRMEKEFQEDRHFHKKVIELLRAHDIGTTEDWAYLEGLAKS
tara:strand:- start:110 stop:427 length:318 start_codon:yes stop_codon:yes gene_type:complete